jgi:hypothetical protein
MMTCNRRGFESDAVVHWIGIEPGKTNLVYPYTSIELEFSATTLKSLQNADTTTLRQIPYPRPPQEGLLPDAAKIIDLLNTDQDLNQADRDISAFVTTRKNLSAYVVWRNFNGTPQDRQIPPIEELCRVNVYELQNYLKGERVWRHSQQNGWISVAASELTAGQIVLLPCAAGGYDEGGSSRSATGFTGNAKDKPSPVASILDDNIPKQFRKISLHAEVCDEQKHTWTIAQATQCWKQSLTEMLHQLPSDLPTDPLIETVTYALSGRSTTQFQNWIIECNPTAETEPIQVWANRGLRRSQMSRTQDRSQYWYEVASVAIAAQQSACPLAQFLIAAHQGRLRMRLIPEIIPNEDRFLLNGESDTSPTISHGIIHGDACLEIPLATQTIEAHPIDLEQFLPPRHSWSQLTQALVDRWGPYQLMYFEALSRTAFWSAIASFSKGAKS